MVGLQLGDPRFAYPEGFQHQDLHKRASKLLQEAQYKAKTWGLHVQKRADRQRGKQGAEVAVLCQAVAPHQGRGTVVLLG